MFKLKPNPIFRATVEISVPGEDAQPIRLPLDFAHLSRSEYERQIVAPGLTVEEAVKLVVCGWGLDDPPFTPERFAELLDDYQAAPGEIFEAYLKEQRASKRKN